MQVLADACEDACCALIGLEEPLAGPRHAGMRDWVLVWWIPERLQLEKIPDEVSLLGQERWHEGNQVA